MIKSILGENTLIKHNLFWELLAKDPIRKERPKKETSKFYQHQVLPASSLCITIMSCKRSARDLQSAQDPNTKRAKIEQTVSAPSIERTCKHNMQVTIGGEVYPQSLITSLLANLPIQHYQERYVEYIQKFPGLLPFLKRHTTYPLPGWWASVDASSHGGDWRFGINVYKYIMHSATEVALTHTDPYKLIQVQRWVQNAKVIIYNVRLVEELKKESADLALELNRVENEVMQQEFINKNENSDDKYLYFFQYPEPEDGNFDEVWWTLGEKHKDKLRHILECLAPEAWDKHFINIEGSDFLEMNDGSPWPWTKKKDYDAYVEDYRQEMVCVAEEMQKSFSGLVNNTDWVNPTESVKNIQKRWRRDMDSLVYIVDCMKYFIQRDLHELLLLYVDTLRLRCLPEVVIVESDYYCKKHWVVYSNGVTKVGEDDLSYEAGSSQQTADSSKSIRACSLPPEEENTNASTESSEPC